MPDSPRLPVRKCAACGALETGARVFCSRCGGSDLQPAEVAGSGAIVSWTVVRRPAAAFQHLGAIPVVMVALDEGAVVTGRFDGQPSDLVVGAPVALARQEDGVACFEPSADRT